MCGTRGAGVTCAGREARGSRARDVRRGVTCAGRERAIRAEGPRRSGWLFMLSCVRFRGTRNDAEEGRGGAVCQAEANGRKLVWPRQRQTSEFKETDTSGDRSYSV